MSAAGSHKNREFYAGHVESRLSDAGDGDDNVQSDGSAALVCTKDNVVPRRVRVAVCRIIPESHALDHSMTNFIGCGLYRYVPKVWCTRRSRRELSTGGLYQM